MAKNKKNRLLALIFHLSLTNRWVDFSSPVYKYCANEEFLFLRYELVL